MATKISRLRTSVEASHRRIIDLKQNAALARSVRNERTAQRRLFSAQGDGAALEEAEAMIARVLEAEDPTETRQITQDINDDLNHLSVADRLAEKGFGKPTKTTAKDVLQRLMVKPQTA